MHLHSSLRVHLKKGTLPISGQQASSEPRGVDLDLLARQVEIRSTSSKVFICHLLARFVSCQEKESCHAFIVRQKALFIFVVRSLCAFMFAKVTTPRLCLKRRDLRCPEELYFAALQLSFRGRYAISESYSFFFPVEHGVRKLLPLVNNDKTGSTHNAHVYPTVLLHMI